MPVFRNVNTRRSSGRIWKQDPITYDEQGWEIPCTSRTPSPRISHLTTSTPSSQTVTEPGISGRQVRKTKHTRRQESGHIPRPRNRFILFRSEFYKKAREASGGQDQNDISVRAGRAWNALTEEQKKPFEVQAEREKLEHQARYPDYSYAPGNRNGRPKPRPKSARPVKSKKRKSVIARFKSEETEEFDLPPPISIPTLPVFHQCFYEGGTPSPDTQIPEGQEPPTKNVAEPFLDLRYLEDETSGPKFDFDWTFVPTSAIPPLELSPKSSDPDLYGIDPSLRPASYDYIDICFGFKSSVSPHVMNTFPAVMPSPDETGFFAYDQCSQTPFLPCTPPIHSDWDHAALTMSSRNGDYNYLDLDHSHVGAPRVDHFDMDHTEHGHEILGPSPAVPSPFVSQDEEIFMNQFFRFL